MLKTYTVNDGHRLVMPDNVVLEGGDEIKLDDESASRHFDRVTLKVKTKPVEPTKAEPTETPAPVDKLVAKK